AGVDCLLATGAHSAATLAAARAAGVPRAEEFATVDLLTAALRGIVREGDAVLIKASRSARFERVGAALRAARPEPCPA
ncbi:MAG: hypothetical protein ACKVYV_01445, partial [Limisphaerales bacterium]